jgi:integrase
LTQELVVDFASADPSGSADKKARRYNVIRRFCGYLATFDPQTPSLDPKLLPRTNSRHPSRIITDFELSRLLYEARRISQRNPMRGVTLEAMIGLAASTGLRISEVVRLDRSDVDIKTGILSIRCTKFYKDRYVPTHPSTLSVLQSYAALRDATYSQCRDLAFFVTTSKGRFCCITLRQSFQEVAKRAGLRGPTGKGISFHSLRHRFAVKRLVAWYSAGVDVQAMLPALATYMGHVHYSYTAHYLTATAELMGLAAERYNRWFDEVEAPQ